ncbi:MAG: hypothetical protein GF398_03965 [Chitinivibrionales bacterium]|nr:hypothetical protein [Chitinivibrionales bacterium]
MCMKDLSFPFFCSVFLFMVSVPASAREPRHELNIFKWACYFGEDSAAWKKLQNFDLAVVDPDKMHGYTPDQSSTEFLANLPLCRTHTYRWFFRSIQNQPYVLWSDPDDKSQYTVDVRSKAWQKELVRRIIPRIQAKGYDGLLLNDIDVAFFLEGLDGEAYEATVQATINLIKHIRKQFPDMILAAKNGLPASRKFGKFVDVLIVDALNTRWNETTKSYAYADSSWREDRLDYLKTFRRHFPHTPVLAIDFMNFRQRQYMAYSREQCAKYSILCYRPRRDLQTLIVKEPE